MSDYIIMTDSSCDLPAETAEKYDITCLPLSTQIGGRTYKNYLDGSGVNVQWFYDQLRAKQHAVTSAVNAQDFMDAMEPILRSGRDILYIGFSSGLSSTYESGAMAAAALAPKYPERKIYAVDTLAASLGQGLLVWLAARKKENGASIDEVRDYVESIKLHLCHWFTVDDLFHLKRGGRVSATAAVLGSMLGIKPVLHVDNEGHLINMEKARGRRASIERLAEKAAELGTDLSSQTVFISHGDCIEDARYLEKRMRELGVKDVLINYVGPVIGAHSGPGTLALFFLGRER